MAEHKSNLRELEFVLFEQFKVQDQAEAWGLEEQDYRMLLTEADKFCTEVLWPTREEADRVGVKRDAGDVTTPSSYKPAYKGLYEQGWAKAGVADEFGGQPLPGAFRVCLSESLGMAGGHISIFLGLTRGAAHLIEVFGTPEQRDTYCQKMFDGVWGGTMCLTESQAGSDVVASRSKAVPLGDGKYKISGTKAFISAGDHDLTENVIHMVLARIEGAAPGTKGLSLFIVPKMKVGDDGNIDGPNDVKCAGIEHKMGLHGSPTCELLFGDDDDCVGILLGEVEHQGIRQMFQMMNEARVNTGVSGLLSSTMAYIHARDYAKERVQGKHLLQMRNPEAESVTIINHADVRRMLLIMKSETDAFRALLCWAASLEDRSVKADNDDERLLYDHVFDVLTPLCKAYPTDRGEQVVNIGIQVLGGVGYCRDYPLEQIFRDCRVQSIYEGTTHIQSLDLAFRKLNLGGGEYFASMIKELRGMPDAPDFADELAAWDGACKTVEAMADKLRGWAQSMEVARVPVHANRFLIALSRVVAARLLIDQARIAKQAIADGASGADRDFYDGKIHTMRFYLNTLLPEVNNTSALMEFKTEPALDMAEASF